MRPSQLFLKGIDHVLPGEVVKFRSARVCCILLRDEEIVMALFGVLGFLFASDVRVVDVARGLLCSLGCIHLRFDPDEPLIWGPDQDVESVVVW